jgi:N-methylhydantoinase A
VKREDTFEAEERLLASGEIYAELTDSEVERVVEAVRASEAEAVAICFLHSYVDPTHENRVADRLRSALGRDVYVTASNEIVREYREYERIRRR